MHLTLSSAITGCRWYPTPEFKKSIVRELTALARKIIPLLEQLQADAEQLGMADTVLHASGKVIRTRSQLLLRVVS